MPTRDIITIGASAGGIEPLSELLAGLPVDFPAALFIVVHLPPQHPSHLPAVLARRSRLPVIHATAHAPILPGQVMVAPPDLHLVVREGHVELSRDARENRVRPAIDVLFRSAARAYGSRVVGVALSGALDDGTVGAMAIRAHGGVIVVQDPAEALIASIPQSVITHAGADYIRPVAAIPPLLMRLAQGDAEEGGSRMQDDEQQMEEVIAQDMAEQVENRRIDEPSIFTCPDCGGTLWQHQNGRFITFQCHVGHKYSARELLADKAEELEAALWRAVRLMKEKTVLTHQLAEGMRERGQVTNAARVAEQAEQDERHIAVIRENLLEGSPAPTNQILVVLESLQADDPE